MLRFQVRSSALCAGIAGTRPRAKGAAGPGRSVRSAARTAASGDRAESAPSSVISPWRTFQYVRGEINVPLFSGAKSRVSLS